MERQTGSHTGKKEPRQWNQTNKREREKTRPADENDKVKETSRDYLFRDEDKTHEKVKHHGQSW